MRTVQIKTIFLLLIILTLSLSVHLEQIAPTTATNIETDKSNLCLNISNIKTSKGGLYISVYNTKETFLSEDKVLALVVPVIDVINNDEAVIDISLSYGEYAISVHYDENDNKKMDRNFIGIPKEPVALSNNHIPRFGPPKYNKAKFLVDQPQMDHIFILN